jgi:hypothetical protein
MGLWNVTARHQCFSLTAPSIFEVGKDFNLRKYRMNHFLFDREAVVGRLPGLLLLSVGLPVANAPDVLQSCGLLYYP